MISQKMKASARILGVGLLALAVTAPAALAQAKKVQCPFTSKDVDGWYKTIGFDTGADDAGTAPVIPAVGSAETLTCAIGATNDFATLDEIEVRQGKKVVDGATVDGLSTFKHILVNLQAFGGPNNLPYYTIELIRDGVPVADAKAGNMVGLSGDQYLACVSALTSSMAWNRWACRNK